MKFRRSDRTAFRRIGDQMIVVDLKHHHAYALNETGGAIWQAAERLGSPEELAALFEPEEDRPAIEREVAAFLARLRVFGLVEAEAPEDHQLGSVEIREVTPFAAPEIVWHEPIACFAQSCMFESGTGEPCDTFPVL